MRGEHKKRVSNTEQRSRQHPSAFFLDLKHFSFNELISILIEQQVHILNRPHRDVVNLEWNVSCIFQ